MRVFQYPNCSTCKKALRYLTQRGLTFESVNIVEAPPSKKELQRALELSGLPLAKLFNTSGQAYREGDYKSRLATLSESQALADLAKNGKLIKRPLILGEDFALVGFDEAKYQKRFG